MIDKANSLDDEGLILVLDIGTSSVRAALYDLNGERLDETFVKDNRQLHLTNEGGAELEAHEALTEIENVIDEVLQKAGNLSDKIKFACASSFWHSLIGVNENGDATTKVFGWADTRSKNHVQTLRENLDEKSVHNRTGSRFHSSYWTAKLLWLREEQPEVFKQTAQWLSFSDFFGAKFFGENATSVSMASGTGIFNQKTRDFDEELLRFLQLKRENLPRIAEDSETFKLNETYAKRWESLRDVKWFLAIGDGVANNIGAGCTTKTEVALMIGTSGAMRVLYEAEPPEVLPSGLWCYRLDRKRVIVGGALSDGGGLYRWLKENLRLKGIDDEIEDAIAAREPDSHGLTFLPFLAGERGTNYNENATGAILGLTAHTTSLEITQAALESVAYRFAAIAEQLNRVTNISEIMASGGALRESPIWTQIICDALNHKLTLPNAEEASSRGAVLFALESIGKLENISELPCIKGQNFTPNLAKHTVYKSAKLRQEELYERINSNSY
ncbi:MAG: gluconokinase [Pyrinomonadaceae bacterium]|nr:gluconokinase [Pyrinomonadaceae bacterium]